MAETSIEWTATPRPDGTLAPGFTLNPWSGCSKVAEGCRFCYAEVNYSVKMRGVRWGPNGTRVRLSDDGWRKPLAWNRAAEAEGVRLKVFCASLADVFEDWQGPILNAKGNVLARLSQDGKQFYAAQASEHEPAATMADLRRDLFALIDKTPWLDWLLLTKRPENIRRMWAPTSWGGRCASFPDCDHPDCQAGRRRDNVWLGCSIATQKDADQNLPLLLACRDLAPVLFVSAEPLIEAVDLSAFLFEEYLDMPQRWVIVGGESGPHARPCNVAWVRSLVQQCQVAGVPCFVKQLGSEPGFKLQDEEARGNLAPSFHYSRGGLFIKRMDDPKGGDPAEWPEDLRVRQFPEVAHA